MIECNRLLGHHRLGHVPHLPQGRTGNYLRSEPAAGTVVRVWTGVGGTCIKRRNDDVVAAGFLIFVPGSVPRNRNEIQDFGPAEVSLIRALVPPGPDDLFLCGDAGQGIFRRPFSWSSKGIRIQGRSASSTPITGTLNRYKGWQRRF